MTGQVLVAGIGNLFLTDDGFGSEVARRLAASAAARGRARSSTTASAACISRTTCSTATTRLVVVDALPGDGRAGRPLGARSRSGRPRRGRARRARDGAGAVLASLGQLGGSLPPTYVVGCQPADVGEGMGLTPAVAAAVDGADRPRPRGAQPNTSAARHASQRGRVMRKLGILTAIVGLVVGRHRRRDWVSSPSRMSSATCDPVHVGPCSRHARDELLRRRARGGRTPRRRVARSLGWGCVSAPSTASSPTPSSSRSRLAAAGGPAEGATTEVVVVPVQRSLHGLPARLRVRQTRRRPARMRLAGRGDRRRRRGHPGMAGVSVRRGRMIAAELVPAHTHPTHADSA